MNRKFPCSKQGSSNQVLPKNLPVPTEEKINDPLSDSESNIKCNHCNKVFTQQSSLTRHLNDRCKVKKESDKQKEDKFAELMSEMEQMKSQLKDINKIKHQLKEMDTMKIELNELRKQVTNTGTGTGTGIGNVLIKNQQNIENQQNIQVNNVNNIKLLAFGKEDLKHITDEICRKILNKGFKCIPTFIEFVHFNKNKPENHNIYISNMQNSYVMLYNGKEWVLKERDETLQQLMEDKTDYLSDKFDELIETIDEHTLKKFRRFMEQKGESHVVSQVKKDIKLLLYNNRKLPEQMRELLEFKPTQ
jgi:uncharacterized C2H2 Zn-finger protein